MSIFFTIEIRYQHVSEDHLVGRIDENGLFSPAYSFLTNQFTRYEWEAINAEIIKAFDLCASFSISGNSMEETYCSCVDCNCDGFQPQNICEECGLETK